MTDFIKIRKIILKLLRSRLADFHTSLAKASREFRAAGKIRMRNFCGKREIFAGNAKQKPKVK